MKKRISDIPFNNQVDDKEEATSLAGPLFSTRIERTTDDMISQAASLTDLSIEALEQVVRNGEKDSDRIAAAVALLDRGHGKPTQQVSIRSNAGNTIKEALKFIEDNGMTIDGDVVEVKD